jgi:hypothetical protein
LSGFLKFTFSLRLLPVRDRIFFVPGTGGNQECGSDEEEHPGEYILHAILLVLACAVYKRGKSHRPQKRMEWGGATGSHQFITDPGIAYGLLEDQKAVCILSAAALSSTGRDVS